MDEINLKQRLVGAVVLVSLAVIFIPLILDGRDPSVNYISKSNIPPKPERDFVSRVIPLNPSPVPEPEVLEPEVIPEPVAIKPAAEAKPKIEAPAAAKLVEKSAELKTTVKAVTKPEVKIVAKPKTVVKPKTGLSAWAIQVGSFGSKKNAYALREKLRKQGFTAFVDTLYDKDTASFRVRVGPEIKRERAEAIQAKLAKLLKTKPIVVKHP